MYFLLDFDTVMDTSSIQRLPKLLVAVLGQLLDEKDISTWNMQVNGEIAYLNLRFAPIGHFDPITPGPGFRRKSPSERFRDFNRISQYKNSYQNQEINFSHENITDTVIEDKNSHLGNSDSNCENIGQTQPCESKSECVLRKSDLDSADSEVDSTPHSGQNQNIPVAKPNKTEVIDTIEDTFNKAVIDKESKLIGAITQDNRVVLYGYTKPNPSNRLEIITCRSDKYNLNIDTIKDLENIMNDETMHDYLFDMCLKYDENMEQLKTALIGNG